VQAKYGAALHLEVQAIARANAARVGLDEVAGMNRLRHLALKIAAAGRRADG
jgi:hypothetical protein